LASAIGREKKAVRQIVEAEGVDLVFSDNRYGCRHESVHSVILTHQLNIQCPPALRRLGPGVNHIIQKLLGKFNEVWVPDFGGEPSLSGALSHPAPLPAVYTGPLSRFYGKPCTEASGDHLLVLCSGPEPQRTLFEGIVRRELHKTGRRAVLVRGVMEGEPAPAAEGNLSVYNWLPSEKMHGAICSARLVVSRPGYSTVMDLACLGKPAVFVPTPGQTEQEYLASEFFRKKLFYCERQDRFDLARALEGAGGFGGLQVENNPGLLSGAIDALLGRHRATGSSEPVRR
jgi:hypothetical protein